MTMDRTTPHSSKSSSEAIVRLIRASKVFNSGDGVQDLDLDVESGSIFGFIGPSGSGKTTTVRLMTGVISPTDGEVTVFGSNPSDFTAKERERIGYMPQLSVLYPNLTVTENLRFLASMYGAKWNNSSRMGEVLDFVELTGHESKRVRDISGGMQRRLALAATLVHKPQLIFLDEPTAGVDPVLRRKFWDHFGQLKSEGRTMFVTTQYVGEAAYCDRVGVLADGELLLVDTPDGLRRRAFGGDVIHVDFAQRPDPNLVKQIEELVAASNTKFYSTRGISFTVEEAATALPELSSWLAEQHVDIDQAEEHLPPFDDVFVELVNRHRETTAVRITEDVA